MSDLEVYHRSVVAQDFKSRANVYSIEIFNINKPWEDVIEQYINDKHYNHVFLISHESNIIFYYKQIFSHIDN